MNPKIEWKPGLILREKDHKFDDGTIRDKYLVVLFVNKQQAYVIQSLTTSKNKLELPAIDFGCRVHNHRIPYFYIPAGRIIGDQDFAFEKDTFIFFNQNVFIQPIAAFENAIKKFLGLIELGVLSNEDLKAFIECALTSNFVPGNIAVELQGFLRTLNMG